MTVHWTEIYFLSEWAVRLLMLCYVPQRRSPAAARTWLLLIFIFPWPGLVLYGLFGRAFLPQRRLQLQEKFSQLVRTVGKQVLAPYGQHPGLPPRFQQAVTLAENLGDFGIVGGNQVELVADYTGAINRLIDDIGAARHHVHLLYYIFADDDTGNRVANALSQAVQRGVSCRVLLDSLGSKKWRRRLVPRLRQAGIEVIELLPVRIFRMLHGDEPRPDLRNHRKIAIIDGRIAYVGSQNLVDAMFKKGIIYEELVARVTGPVVLQLQSIFLIDRYFEAETELARSELFPVPEQAGNVIAQILPSGPGYPQSNNQRLITMLVHAAHQRVVITTPYFIPDDALLEAMKTAVQRGVEVHLVVSCKVDQLLVGLAQRSYYDEMLEAGVRLHQYRQHFLHAKHVTIDDMVTLIGSSNMDIRSFQLNAEISLLVYNAPLTQELHKIQKSYFEGADQLTLAGWRQRPFILRMGQNMARLFDSLL